MGIVIEFQDVVERRRRRRRRESLERCVEILEINLAYARWMSDNGPDAERALYSHRTQVLRALRDYAVRVL